MSGPFHATIHPRSAAVADGPVARFDRGAFPTLLPSTADLASAFSRSFEEVCEALAQLPRMFIEPDGSWVWVSASDQPAWQLDGMLFDRDERLLYVEWKGTCPPESFDRLLAALGWPQTAVMLQLVREAVFLSEAEFRRYAGWAEKA